MAAALEQELGEPPKQDESRLDFLWRLLEPQARERSERSVARRIREARFPATKSLDDFDFAFQEKLDRHRVEELATLAFIERGQNVLIGGMSGTGKSHIAISLGHLACARGLRVRYTTSAAMLTELYASLAGSTLALALKPYTRCDLLIVDEVGLDRPERDATRDAHLFYKVVSARYETQKSTVITSNIDWKDWGTYLGDDIASVAILDRLVHRGFALSIEGPSWRAAEHERLNRRATKRAKA